MELLEYNPDNTCTYPNTIEAITIYKKGTIVLSKSIFDLMNLKKGMKVVFFQDKHNPWEWYMSVSSTGFPIHIDGRKHSLSSKFITDKILESNKYDISKLEMIRFRVDTSLIVSNGRNIYKIMTDKVIARKSSILFK